MKIKFMSRSLQEVNFSIKIPSVQTFTQKMGNDQDLRTPSNDHERE